MSRGGHVYDVIVIGAGPAGGMAAWQLGPHLRVLLLEKARLPREKLCSGVLSRKSVTQLPCLDLLPALRGSVQQTWIGKRGRGTTHRHGSPLLFVSRARLDLALVEAAARRGANICDRCRVVRIDPAEGRVVLASGREIHARVIIGADGANGISVRALNDVLAPRGLAMEMHVPDGCRQREAAAVDFCTPHGYAWAFPKADGSLAIGVGSLKPSPLIGLRQALEAFARRLSVALPTRCLPGHPMPAVPQRTLVAGRLLLAGDAAGLVDPLIGEGIPYALWSGRLAAQAAMEHLLAGAPLLAYRQAIRQIERFLSPLRRMAQYRPLLERLGPTLSLTGVRAALWRMVIERQPPLGCEAA